MLTYYPAPSCLQNCAIFNGFNTCQQYLEARPCAIWCNPGGWGGREQAQPEWVVEA